MNFQEYFRDKDLTKKPRQGLHYEQKTTPDLLWCVSHVVLEITKGDRNHIFSDKEIRFSPLFDSLMQDYFSKPSQALAPGEYNKVSSYQLGLLCYAGLIEQVSNHPKKYQIRNLSALEYMSINDLNASKFLTEYTEKFLIDNGLISVFENYKNNPSQGNHLIAKDKYWEWARINTAIRGSDRKHTYRVFNKIFNVYCYKHKIPGEDGSNITTGPCPYSFLIYNRKNFRDENMPTGMTRREYLDNLLLDIDVGGVVEIVLVQKAKADIKRKYNGVSELQDLENGFVPESGIHVHHMLPQSSYPQFASFRENLIALTPGQHLSFAHVQGNTQKINSDFLRICLKKKFEHIKESINNGEDFYKLSNFIQIVNSAFIHNLEETATLAEVESIF